jgi:hypothetical protein
VSVIPIQAGPVLQGRAGLGQDLEMIKSAVREDDDRRDGQKSQ